jgi:cytochrome c oxidase subunit IV
MAATEKEKHVELRNYVAVYVALLALTGATVGLAFVKLGDWHTSLGLAIATAKVLLVVLFFMHVLRSTKIIWIVAIGGLFWLGILLTFTLTDYLTRSWLTY